MAAINLPRIIRVGGGTLAELPAAMAQCGFARPFMVTDAPLVGSGLAARLVGMLEAAGLTVTLFSDTVPDPTASDPSVVVVEQALEALRWSGSDCVIGFGGGSPIDTAKVIAALALGPRPIPSLKAPMMTDNGGLPVIAVPTTAGTGSEATKFAIVTDEATSEKMLCAGLAFLPTIAIVDFDLTMGNPARLTADTGLASLAHAIEAYVSRQANPFSDAMALSACKLIAPNIRTAFAEPDNRAAREAMMVGAHHAGIAISNASVALVHGMSCPMGAFFNMPHGLSKAMLLPVVTAFSAAFAPGRYAECARAMGVASDADDDQAAVVRLLEELAALNRDLAVPTPRSHGISQERWFAVVPEMARQAIASGSPGNNPRVADAAQIERLYAEVFG